MTPDQLQRRAILFARNDAALDRWPDGEDPAFKQEVEAVAYALQDLACEADAADGDRLERTRTWRYAGNAFYDLSSGKADPALRHAYAAYSKAEALLENIDDAEEQRKLDYYLGHTLMGLSQGKNLDLAREAQQRYARSLQTARRAMPEAVASAEHALAKEAVASAEHALAKAERLITVLAAADHLSQEIVELEEKLQQRQASASAAAGGAPMAPLFEVLKNQFEAEKQKGTMDGFQQEELEHVMGDLEALVKTGPFQTKEESLAGNVATRNMLDTLAERLMPRIKGSAFEHASGRAGRVLAHIQALKLYVTAEGMRPGIATGEAVKVKDLLFQLSQLTTTLTNAEAEQLRRIEREVARPLAREVCWYDRRRHMTLVRPRWTREKPPPDPNLVFFSGPDEVRLAVHQAAEPIGLEVSSASYVGAVAAAARWNDLAAASLAVFDLSAHDPQGFYELGIALTVGTNLLLLAKFGTVIPFDVAQDVHYYKAPTDLSSLLPHALDAALYGLQTKRMSGSSLRESIAYLERLIPAETDTSMVHTALEHMSDLMADPVKGRAALNSVNAYLGTKALLPLYPRWPGVYPDPLDARCFIVMPFRKELDSVYADIVKVCRDAGITPIRGDVAQGQEIIESIWEEIGRATHLVVDLTGLNLNVCLELGIADTLGRPTLLMGCHGTEKRLFASIASRRCHTYATDLLSEPGVRHALNLFLPPKKTSHPG
jgi:hypothetical protein